MIDIEDLIEYLYDEGKIRNHRGTRGQDIQITCPRTHYKLNKNTGEYEAHYERRPSLGISLDEPYVFNCFGCGFKGTIEFLLAEVLDISVMEAVRWLSQRYEFTEEHYRKVNTNAQRKIKEYEELFGQKIEVKEYDESYFIPFRKVHRYTLDRGFSLDIAKKYEIGFDEWQRRIVMPIRNNRGRIIGLYGRAIDEDNEAKYLYYNYTDEGELIGFDKGLFLLKNKEIQRKKIALIVESGLDVPWADQNGLTEEVDVISILGSSPTREQAEMLGGYEELILGLDKDQAGDKGKRLMIKYLDGRAKISDTEYPQGTKDLGDCNKEQMFDLVRNRKSLLEKKISKLKYRLE